MFLAFDPYLLLLIIICCFFLPGVLISLALLKNTKLSYFEKVAIGLGLGFSVPQLLPFLAYFFFGLKYTYDLAIITIAVWWAVAIGLAAWQRLDKEIANVKQRAFYLAQEDKKKALIYVAIVFLAVLAFWIRFGTYSPVFQELDPYYYTYIPQQILQFGHNPLNDQTSWWPVVEVNHRGVPVLAYMEALWYSLYNGSNTYNNMLLAVIASIYPPIAAMLATLFFFILLSRITKMEYALIGAGISSLAPVFIMKTLAGESEVQPYAFFALAFFYAAYLLAIKEKNRIVTAVAVLAYVALALGCSSELVGLVTMLSLSLLFCAISFYRSDPAENIRAVGEVNAIILLFGTVLAGGIIKPSFQAGSFAFSQTSVFLAGIIIAAFVAVYFIQKRKFEILRNRMQVLAALLIIGLVFILSPLGEPIKTIGRAGFSVAEYKTALERTIAEQGLAGSDFSRDMGFVGATYYNIAVTILSPLSAVFGKGSEEFVASLINLLALVLAVLFGLFSILSNILLNIIVNVLNILLGSNVVYEWKANTFAMFWPSALVLAYVYYFNKNKNATTDEWMPALLLLMPLIFLFIVGIIRAKFTIYAAFMLGGGIAFVLANLEDFLKERKLIENTSRTVVYLGIFLLLMQFFFGGFAPALAVDNFKVRFQDNPLAVKEDLAALCKEKNDPQICLAAADPLKFASLGTNYQYNTKLCLYTASFSRDPTSPSAQLRCNRVSEYWIDSMEWIRYQTEPDSRTISWWDYGHWINFFGQKNAVLRNEHASLEMIYRVANAYVEGTENDLIQTMKDYGAKYALFDVEILASSGGFGAKYGALNYLGCVHVNRTNVSYLPGNSDCEIENLWETIYISPNKPCVISNRSKKMGYTASKVYLRSQNGELKYTPYYPDKCINATDETLDAEWKYICTQVVQLQPVYCVGEAELANGQKITATYYLNETTPTGDLKLNKAFLTFQMNLPNVYGQGNLVGFTTLYTKDKVWLENGTIVDGYSDRKGHFYDSNIYKAFILNELEGFEKVYDNGAVKIYKLKQTE